MDRQTGSREIAHPQARGVVDKDVLELRVGPNMSPLNVEAAILLVERQAVTMVTVPRGLFVIIGFGVASRVGFLPEIGDVIAIIIFRNGEVVFFSALYVGGYFALIVVENGCGREMAVGAPVVGSDRDGGRFTRLQCCGALTIAGGVESGISLAVNLKIRGSLGLRIGRPIEAHAALLADIRESESELGFLARTLVGIAALVELHGGDDHVARCRFVFARLGKPGVIVVGRNDLGLGKLGIAADDGPIHLARYHGPLKCSVRQAGVPLYGDTRRVRLEGGMELPLEGRWL